MIESLLLLRGIENSGGVTFESGNSETKYQHLASLFNHKASTIKKYSLKIADVFAPARRRKMPADERNRLLKAAVAKLSNAKDYLESQLAGQ